MHHEMIYQKPNWVSLTSCGLWDKTADHKKTYYSQTVVMRQYIRCTLVECHLPTVINNIRSCHDPLRIWWQLTCVSLSRLSAICSITNLFFMKDLECYSHADEQFASIYHSIWRSLTFLSTYWHSNFPMLMCIATKMHTQKCGNFENTMKVTSSHDECWCFITCLNNDNVSNIVSDIFYCDPYWSADLTQRSRLFICVETNSPCMMSSSIASAVCWVNSAQFFSARSMSMKHYSHFFQEDILFLLTFQSHICLRRIFGIQNFR